jgi:hypothetical protein
VELTGPALAESSGNFYSRAVNKEDPELPVIVHRGQPILDEAIRNTKKGEGGKKDQRADAAKKANVGRFTPAAPPRLVAAGGKKL